MSAHAMFIHVIKLYIKPLMLLLGLVGNTVCIAVLRKRPYRTSTAVYLLMVSILSLLVVIVYSLFFFFDLLPAVHSSFKGKWLFIFINCFITFPLLNMLAISGSWIVTAVSIERCVVVGFPLRGRRWCRRKLAWFVCSALMVLSVLVNIPRFFNCKPHVISNYSYPMNRTVVKSRMKVLNFPIYNLASIVLSSVIPFIVVLVCNIILIALMVRRWKRSRRFSADGGVNASRNLSTAKEKRSITAMTLASTSLFLVSQSMSSVNAVLLFIYGWKLPNVGILFFYANTLATTFFCFTPIIYLFISRAFRKNAGQVIQSAARHSRRVSSSFVLTLRLKSRDNSQSSSGNSSKENQQPVGTGN